MKNFYTSPRIQVGGQPQTPPTVQCKRNPRTNLVSLSWALWSLSFLRSNSLFQSDPVSARDSHTAVWTGSEMIVWGQTRGVSVYLDTGGRYDPGTDGWVATCTTNAPEARVSQTAIWSGSEMILWGGAIGVNYLSTGGRYCAQFGPRPTPTPTVTPTSTPTVTPTASPPPTATPRVTPKPRPTPHWWRNGDCDW